jgi:lipopolysaccharide/colanic/teichoic acid biosynthesis glycosyltransferase
MSARERLHAVAGRALDLLLAGTALLVLAPLLVAFGVAVRLGSPGPALFRQTRVGRGGRPFVLLKLRTMRLGAVGPRVTPTGDARVTALGRRLRRWKLDELPQLLNVVRGEMSLVGPRPEVPEYLARLGAAADDYLAVRPGLADPATLAFYDEAALLAAAPDPERHYLEVVLPAKAALSLAYQRERTLASDLRVLWAVARRVGGLETGPRSWRSRHV